MTEQTSTPAAQTPEGATCGRCGATFTCGVIAGLERCWCADMPPLPTRNPTATACYCPSCLRTLTSCPTDTS